MQSKEPSLNFISFLHSSHNNLNKQKLCSKDFFAEKIYYNKINFYYNINLKPNVDHFIIFHYQFQEKIYKKFNFSNKIVKFNPKFLFY